MTSRPHDALFKAAFESPANAATLLQALLAPAVSSAIAWASLTREAGSFIDPKLADRHTDLLFSAEIGDHRALIYLLLEHQSTDAPDMLLRMLEYETRVLRRHNDEQGRPFPIVIPALVCHAPEGWRQPHRFHEFFAPPPDSHPGLAELVPDFSLVVLDLTTVDNETLRGWTLTALSELAVWLLRDGRDFPRLLRNLHHFARTLRGLRTASSGVQGFMQVLRYISLMTDDRQFEEFRVTLQTHDPESEALVITYAEKLRQEGRLEGLEKGLEKGRQEGCLNILVKLLKLKFGELSPAVVVSLAQASEAELERYTERILDANSIDEVFAD